MFDGSLSTPAAISHSSYLLLLNKVGLARVEVQEAGNTQ